MSMVLAVSVFRNRPFNEQKGAREMRKAKVFGVLVVIAFFVKPQVGFSQTATVLQLRELGLFQTATTVELNENVNKLRRVTADLEKLHGPQLRKLQSPNVTIVDVGECMFELFDIVKVRHSFEIIIYSTVALHGWLIGCECVKDIKKEKWHQTAKGITHGAINTIDSEKRKISRIRPNITNAAALISIEKGRDATIIILDLLRKAEREISVSHKQKFE